MSESTTLARVLVRQIIEAGITDVVISPGSRNAPLSFAFYAAQKKGLIKIHVRIDERGAAFFALGLAKATGRAVPIVCTSGTAVANYHPAVLEAHHSNVPLLVLTADRPARLRKTGANQTTEQARIFGKSVRYFADISGSAYPMELPLYSLQSGPVHLNIQFDLPLAPDDDATWLDEIKVVPRQVKSSKGPGTLRVAPARGVLVIGHDRGGLSVDEVTKFAAKLAWPVIAEDPLSFPGAVSHAALFLSNKAIADELHPKTVVVIGRTTLSRSINSFIASADKEIVIDPRIATVDTDRNAHQRFAAIPDLEVSPIEPEWIEKWQKYASRTAKLLQTLPEWSEPTIAREFGASIKDGTSVFISSSRPIRDLESFASARAGLVTFANRGLAGIDGNISTATGIAASGAPTIAILGDLSFLHDMTGLIHHEKVDLKFFVINNNGGGIFSTLEHRGADGFEELFGTPHGLDPAAIAKAMGIESKSISTIDQLRSEITSPIKGVSVVVLNVPDRTTNADLIKKVVAELPSI